MSVLETVSGSAPAALSVEQSANPLAEPKQPKSEFAARHESGQSVQDKSRIEPGRVKSDRAESGRIKTDIDTPASTDANVKAKTKAKTRVKADPRYWKPQSSVWYFVAVAAFAVALAVSYFVPANIPGLVAGADYSTDFPVDPTNWQIFLIGVVILLVVLYAASFLWPLLQQKLLHKAQFLVAGGLALAVWDLLTSKLFVLTPPYFPGPVNILAYIPTNWGNLLTHIGASSQLFITGLVLGTILGVGTGILIGWYRQWFYWLFPILKFTGVVPATAWMPIATVLLKPAPVAMTFLLVIASWFIISFMMCQGMESTPKALYEVSETLGAKRSYLLFHVAIPNALPSIFTGISTATSMSLLTLVAAEMMGATAGLGYFINYSKAFNKYYQVYAAIIIMFIVFSIILALIEIAKKRVLRWQEGLVS